VSRRVYKDAWSEPTTLNYIKQQSGKLFDPEVVEAFLAIYDVIKAIRDKYPDERNHFSPATSF
jgi:response regulator RpfG family c-di-GMP phosphodiesterase